LALYLSRVRSSEVLGGSTLQTRSAARTPHKPEVQYASNNHPREECDAPSKSVPGWACAKVVAEHLDPEPYGRNGAEADDDSHDNFGRREGRELCQSAEVWPRKYRVRQNARCD
jgi:hypothetical protein